MPKNTPLISCGIITVLLQVYGKRTRQEEEEEEENEDEEDEVQFMI